MPEQITIVVQFRVTDAGKLIPLNPIHKERFKIVNGLKPGTVLEALFTTVSEDSTGTNGQLAKLHAMFADIAKETGSTVDDVKKQIKNDINFFTHGPEDAKGNRKKVYRSFSKASVDELSQAIEATYLLGDLCNINFKKQY